MCKGMEFSASPGNCNLSGAGDLRWEGSLAGRIPERLARAGLFALDSSVCVSFWKHWAASLGIILSGEVDYSRESQSQGDTWDNYNAQLVVSTQWMSVELLLFYSWMSMACTHLKIFKCRRINGVCIKQNQFGQTTFIVYIPHGSNILLIKMGSFSLLFTQSKSSSLSDQSGQDPCLGFDRMYSQVRFDYSEPLPLFIIQVTCFSSYSFWCPVSHIRI